MKTLSYNDSKIMIKVLKKALETDTENKEKIIEFLEEFQKSVTDFDNMYHVGWPQL